MTDLQERFCYECKHFWVSLDHFDISEYTPGERPSIGCMENHFWSGSDYNAGKFRKDIRKARGCKDFEEAI